MSLASVLRFDVTEGRIEAKPIGRVVLLPENVFRTLFRSSKEEQDLESMRALGDACGAFARDSLAQTSAEHDVAEIAPELVFRALRESVALVGLGKLEGEQWGSAMILKLSGGVALDAESLGIGAFLGGVLRTLSGYEVAAVPVGPGHYFVVHPSIADEVWSLAKRGLSLGDIVLRLESEHLSVDSAEIQLD